ncbi:MAG: NAD(P)/FAD-dependent oxidoreductase [Candidatus Thorarchaeota archaeon]|nr:NAD(P)/FAD-dependent oxidoreductase [Candidatus Thorarchaeota archaeon]
MIHDAIVIGAGPSGLIAADRIAKNGHTVIVLEEHKRIGEPDHCAGLLSSTGLQKLDLIPPKEVIQNMVYGARIHSPSGHSILIERGQREAFVVDRKLFDSWLGDRAHDSGVQILTDYKVKGLRGTPDGHYSIDTPREERFARAIIDAEGSRCQISGGVGLPQVPRQSKYPAYQYEVSGVDIDEDIVEMFYGRHISTGFFSWIIPLSDGRARVGIASRDRSKQRLNAAMKHHPVMQNRLKNAIIERGFGGIVLVGLPVKRTVAGGFLVVGDAAGIVKATTGGGVVVGGTASKIAGDIVSEAISNQDGKLILDKYESKWRSALQRELQTMYLAQRAITSFSDRGLDELVKGAHEMGLLDIVKKEGDMDMQGRVIFSLLKNPKMILLGLKSIRYLNPFL